MRIDLKWRIWGLVSITCFGIIIISFLKIPLKSSLVSSHFFLMAQKRAMRKENVFNIKSPTIATSQPENENEDNTLLILKNTFKKADVNGDRFVDTVELISWIASMIKEHLSEAFKNNIFIFTALDINPRDGMVSWEEYLGALLREQGHDDNFVRNHLSSLKGLDRQTKELIMREKAGWSQVSKSDPSRLTINEFFALKHPESSHATIIAMVEESFARSDVDEDGMLSESEFSDPLLNEVPEQMTHTQFKKERARDFRLFIDANGDGNAERKELIDFYNPSNAQHAEKEAMELMGVADGDKDRKLTLKEVLAHKDRFLRSKMVDVALSFHDEF